MILTGDCVEAMAGMDPASVDAIVTDPPYGLEFMGKEWDRPWAVSATQGVGFTGRGDFTLPAFGDGRNANCRACGGRQRGAKKCGCAEPRWDRHPRQDMLDYGHWSETWAAAALRVAKPGAYLLAFGGTRTVHRLACALEDAGWVIRDMLMWGYASGFPKSRALLKPAWEPIVMARKPGPLRELDIDACRIGFANPDDEAEAKGKNQHTGYANPGSNRDSYSGSMPPRTDYAAVGRWPANLVLTDPVLDGGWEGVVGGGEAAGGISVNRNREPGMGSWMGTRAVQTGPDQGYGDTGTYSRFFLVPKASRADREPLEPGGLEARRVASLNAMGDDPPPGIDPVSERFTTSARRNVHPTVKPTELMRHLVRLVTPPGGLVLDPFLGSGTTAVACEMEGFRWVGIERDPGYVAIAEARLLGIDRGLGLPRVTEDELLDGLLGAAHAGGWCTYHVRRSDLGLVQGTLGWPDLFLAHRERGLVWAIEVKAERGRVEDGQWRWIKALHAGGVRAIVARPSDYDALVRELVGDRLRGGV